MKRMSVTNLTALALGFAFLYVPIVILVIYSFNASRLVTVWGGWSIRWYVELFQDRDMIDAAVTLAGHRVRFGIACKRFGHHGGAGPDQISLPWPHPVRRHDLCAAGHA